MIDFPIADLFDDRKPAPFVIGLPRRVGNKLHAMPVIGTYKTNCPSRQ